MTKGDLNFHGDIHFSMGWSKSRQLSNAVVDGCRGCLSVAMCLGFDLQGNGDSIELHCVFVWKLVHV